MKTGNQKFAKRKLINPGLTQRIIALHESGYMLDFFLEDFSEQLVSDGEIDLSAGNFESRLIDQCFDRISGSFKYIHAIDTICGRKGVLISDELFIVPLNNKIRLVKHAESCYSEVN